MAETSGKDKKMPDGVGPGQRLPCIENRPDGVAKPACDKQDEAGRAQPAIERLDGHHTKPAHEEIAHERHRLEAPRKKDLEENTEYRTPPDHAENGPAQCTAQRNEGIRGIGSCNEQVDGGMIDDLENSPGARASRRVVERRPKVEKDERHTIDGTADHLPCTFSKAGKNNEYNEYGNTDEKTDPMREGIGQLLGGAIGTFSFQLHLASLHRSSRWSKPITEPFLRDGVHLPVRCFCQTDAGKGESNPQRCRPE